MWVEQLTDHGECLTQIQADEERTAVCKYVNAAFTTLSSSLCIIPNQLGPCPHLTKVEKEWRFCSCWSPRGPQNHDAEIAASDKNTQWGPISL